MPREPPLPRAFVSRNLLGVVVPDPGVPGRWGGGVGVSLRRFRGKGPGASHFESLELRVLPGETPHVEPAALRFSAGSGLRAGATGPNPERVSAAAGEEGSAGPRGPASFRGLLPHSGPPAAASVFCFRWSPAL